MIQIIIALILLISSYLFMLPVIISLSGYILSTIHGLFILDRDAR